MTAYFLECHLHLPAPEEPLQNLAGRPVQLRAEQGARFELALGISHQHPTDGDRRETGPVPDGSAGSQFYQAMALPIPVID